VDKNGNINPDLFYLALSIWYNHDSLGLWESEVEIIPQPKDTDINVECDVFPGNKNLFLPSTAVLKVFPINFYTLLIMLQRVLCLEIFRVHPQYTTMSFQVHNLQTNDDYVNLIKVGLFLHGICHSYSLPCNKNKFYDIIISYVKITLTICNYSVISSKYYVYVYYLELKDKLFFLNERNYIY